MRARVEVERDGRPIRPIARPCCNVTTGRGCRTRECKANAPPSTTFCSTLHYGLVGTDVPKAECDDDGGRGEPLEEHDVCLLVVVVVTRSPPPPGTDSICIHHGSMDARHAYFCLQADGDGRWADRMT